MILKNVSLKPLNTFGLDYNASYFIRPSTEEEAIRAAQISSGLVLVVGEGSNLLFLGNFEGTIIRPYIKGVSIEERGSGHAVISAGSGVVWDELVAWSVEKGFSGIENLSMIPGLTGASAVQNIGAYGAEAKDTIVKARAIALADGSIREFSNAECGFGYRQSIFKRELRGKYIITRVYFRLSTESSLNTCYSSLEAELRNAGELTPAKVREAVMRIRGSKLPDPKITGNAGSFFKNPVVSSEHARVLLSSYPQMPCYPDAAGKTKLAAGWLIEQCGWKGKRLGDAAVHDKQALVLVNLGNATGREIFDLSEKVKASVLAKFGVELEREVEIVGAI